MFFARFFSSGLHVFNLSYFHKIVWIDFNCKIVTFSVSTFFKLSRIDSELFAIGSIESFKAPGCECDELAFVSVIKSFVASNCGCNVLTLGFEIGLF